jgi:hypothetical protein
MPVFDPDVLVQVVNKHRDKPLRDAFDAMTADFAGRYPGQIDAGARKWILNNAGGAMGQLAILHASLTEYLLFFGTPIGTEGHSGRYPVDIWDIMIAGEMWCYVEGDLERTTYVPGEMSHLGPGQAKGYRAAPGSWMLEYGRGPIPVVLPFGLADSLFSTLDARSIGATVMGYAKHSIKGILGRPR